MVLSFYNFWLIVIEVVICFEVVICCTNFSKQHIFVTNIIDVFKIWIPSTFWSSITKFFPPILNYLKKKFKIDTKARKNFTKILRNTLLPIFTKVVPFFKKKLFFNMYDIRDTRTICFNIFDIINLWR